MPAAPKRRRKLTKRQIARAHRIERRAAVLGVDAPRGHLGQDSGYSPEEYKGWCLNFFDHFVTDRRRVHTAGCTLERPPRTEGEWAGWLARFVFQAYWGS